jgi:hypothetical protein
MNILKFILEGFDYVYYWFLKIHRNRRDKKEICIFLISIYEGIILVVPSVIIAQHILGRLYLIEILHQYRVVLCVIELIILGLNYLRYSSKHLEIIKKWDSQSEFKEKIRSIIVVLVLFMPFIMILINSEVE